MRTTPTTAVILGLQLIACHCAKHTTGDASTQASPQVRPVFVTGPSVMVYKTRADLADKVPVTLSTDGSSVASYPDPKDLRGASGPPLPTALHKGYLLDNRGINGQVAFLKMTYTEYAALKEAPSAQDLLGMIIDRDPLVELCNCGDKKAFTNEVEQLDRLIDDGELRKICKVMK
jgi:hypothetical protein